MRETKDAITQEVKQSQSAPYQDPPALFEREFVPFAPVTLRAYTSSGGRLVWEHEIYSEVTYSKQLQECQDLIERDLIARVDILELGTTNLLGCLVKQEDKIKQKMGEILMARMNGG